MEMVILDGDEDISHVRLHGTLDSGSLQGIDARFHDATAGRDRSAVVDLSGLDYIASLGIGMLFGCAKSLHRRGHRMVLVAPVPAVEHVLLTVGLHEVVAIVPTLEEGFRLARGTPAP